VDPKCPGHYETAVLCDPLGSKAVRTVTRFDLAAGSGAEWFSCRRAAEGRDTG
jgi:hypothetical protein